MKALLKKLFVDPPEDGKVQFFRSLFVGAAATVADMVALIVLKEFLGLKEHTVIAATIAFILGLVTNYLLSTFWAFRGLNTKTRVAEFTVFTIISVIGLGLNNLIIYFFDSVLGPKQALGSWFPEDKYYILGKCVATVIVFVWNFGMRKILLYSKKKPAASDEALPVNSETAPDAVAETGADPDGASGEKSCDISENDDNGDNGDGGENGCDDRKPEE